MSTFPINLFKTSSFTSKKIEHKPQYTQSDKKTYSNFSAKSNIK